MDRFDVKKAMDQIHISSEMQESIITNVQKQMKYRNRKTKYRKKMAASAAAITLATIAISFPVRAFVANIVRERMENMPAEEVEDIVIMIQEQDTLAHDAASDDGLTENSGREEEPAETTGLADGFSREYSADEEERSLKLWQSYENGTFPESVILQVDNANDAVEGSLCYIRATGVFQLPDREMTDEEILEIIDFQHKMSYAVSQTPAAQEARAEYLAEKEQLRALVQDAGGISADEALAIARDQLVNDFGEKAAEMELQTDIYGNGVFLNYAYGNLKDETKIGIIYFIDFTSQDEHIGYRIDALDGTIIYTQGGS